MSKTLKIFLYSLVGALVGVIGFGAISSATRGEDKKEETVTFETFQDESKYTEVAVNAGDKVANRWFRLYDNATLSINGIFASEGAYFSFNSSNTEYIGNFHGAEASVDFEYRIYDEYVDFYLAEGDIKFMSPAGNDTLYLSKGNIVSESGGAVYFLIPNG